MVRVLLVEDSVVQREILRRILREDDAFEIVGEARDGEEAVRMADERRPDVVLMDIHMPKMNGVEATRAIMRHTPVPIVIASATLKKHDIDLGLEALNAGAVVVIPKPEGAVLLHLDQMAVQLRKEILAASKMRVKRIDFPSSPLITRKIRRMATTAEAIGVCTSTGGPTVLCEIFSLLPRPFTIPILLVQHITQGFEKQFCQWLSSRTGQPAAIATNGQRLTSGIWMSPTGMHLTVSSGPVIRLVESRTSDLHCPSGNDLFISLSNMFAARAIGVLLTGMGDDGAHGLLELKKNGGIAIIQDESSSFIWGMPKVARELGAASCELNPAEIAAILTAIHTKATAGR